MVLRCWRRIWGAVVGREGEKKGGVSVEMFDGQRHIVECMIGMRSKASCSIKGYQVISKAEDVKVGHRSHK